MLRILEFEQLPVQKHSAISYVWRGLPPLEPRGAEFNVRGAEHGDLVGIGMLRIACLAALGHACELVWLNRLCIIQTSYEDRSWQIGKMYSFYNSANPCLVFPGSLRRLAKVFAETSWIQREWTLQETTAPKKGYCVFHWTLGNATAYGVRGGLIEEIEQHTSAQLDLRSLVLLCNAIGHFSCDGCLRA